MSDQGDEMDETKRQTAWREGDRIRATNGTGYSDRVSDEQIEGHIADADVDREAWFIAFARAVLAVRAFERTERSS